ncbi:MAG TPA: PhoU domain-containing protein [Clostridiales bacterium]|nr:PhoU domain-containing protein [Clostridiales bacterium]HQP70731.1 PhoU domain-containing protein [Clostridiales bacterium]
MILTQFFKMMSQQDLLTQALNDTHEMAEIASRQYSHVIKVTFDDQKKELTSDEIEQVRKKDFLLNHFEKSIRKKVFEHLAVNDKEEQELYTAFILTTIVNNFERIGDYAKNILEVAEIKHMLKDEEWNGKIKEYSDKISIIFQDSLSAFKNGDAELAKKVIDEHFELKSKINDDIYKVATKEPDGKVNYVVYGLYLRYLKRISSHLMNIATSITNPIDKIGYYVGDEDNKEDD